MLFGHVWFEEYPTTPGSFVLNGFMYSLIGLHDFANVKLADDGKCVRHVHAISSGVS